ncbi:hypothetical protein SAMN05444156_0247 [Verrucomicrobium sp. GAS474]|uniref:hypothetical protein n=1 Tax=Verrucomicrobium sp. GAS474 TaxID=1882831 RepID=UPI00087B126E|nr:hypothetical protein [Verrucomicrobium sp. GAS474]SDT86905.1 hypothetical protein SAMN05444156_0247 [Verrucomicrobium sp. GAS474]
MKEGRPAYLKRSAADDKTKHQELKTYSALGLGRSYKSVKGRKKLAALADGPTLLIGGDAPDRPQIVVNREAYRKTRLDVLRRVLLEAGAIMPEAPKEVLLDQLHPRVERETYEHLALLHHEGPRLDAAFQRLHGRNPTALERELLVPPEARGPEKIKTAKTAEAVGAINQAAYGSYRAGVIDEVLGQVQARQRHNPARYQTLWAEAVGPEIAMQSRFEKVDPATGTAYFRCMNSALSFRLQRMPDLPAKLTKGLKTPVRQVKVMF